MLAATAQIAVARARRRLGILRVLVSLAAFAASCVVFFLLRHGPLLLSVLAAFVLGLLAMRLHRIIRRELDDHVTLPHERRVIMLSVVSLGVLLIALRLFEVWVDAGFFGFVVIYIAIGVGLQQLRSKPGMPWWLSTGVLLVALAVTGAGLIALALGVEQALWPTLVAGALGVPFGLSMFSERILRRFAARPPSGPLRLGALGMALLVTSTSLILLLGVGSTYAAVFGVGVLLLMLGIAARSTVDVVFVIAVTAVVWTLAQRSVHVPSSLDTRGAASIFVAMGDSFISGEGADAFFEKTNQPGISTCRQAPTAYPVLLLQERSIPVPDKLAFLACSGAVAADVGGPGRGDSQLAKLQRLRPNNIDFAIVSAGGNDALFGTIAQTCLLPIDCTGLENAWISHLTKVERVLDETYAEIRRVLPRVDVYVAPYPIPIGPKRCGYSAFSGKEHEFLHRFTHLLNGTVIRASTRAGFLVVDTMPEALSPSKLRLCDTGRPGDAGVNFLATNSVIGALEQSVNPLNWIHNSLHPNAKGHEAMRSAFVTWRTRVLEGSAPAPIAARIATPARRGPDTRGQCVGADDLEGCTTDWMKRQVARFAIREGWVLAPALAGAWMVALTLLHFWHRLFAYPSSAEAS